MTDNPFGLDQQIRDFIDESVRHFPEDAAFLDARGQRLVYNRLCEAFAPPLPASVRFHDDTIAAAHDVSIPIRRYHTDGGVSDALVLYMHGGGFVVGGLDSHHAICAEFCAEAGCDVIAIDYRLAPEFRHPAQIEDCLAVYRRFRPDYARMIVAGDSAGGNLSAALCAATRGSDEAPEGAVLIYPALGGDLKDLPSYRTMAHAPQLTAADVEAYQALWHGGPKPEDDVLAAPLLAFSFVDHPPTAIFSAEIDPLCDDGEAYAVQLRSAGVDVRFYREEGLIHGYLRARMMSDRAAASFSRIAAAISALARTGGLPA
ncbi:MAG: alpha/beta hydrolase [Pseudomonadota bacterium]